MTSAAADVINHNGRKIGRFKPIWFCYVRMTSALSWSRRHPSLDWADVILTDFQRLYIVICKTLALILPIQLQSVKNYMYAKIQAEICMFTQQNRRGLNRPILRPLWLMTSAAADVISVPGVPLWTTIWFTFYSTSHKILTQFRSCCIVAGNGWVPSRQLVISL